MNIDDLSQFTDDQILMLWDLTSDAVETWSEFLRDDGPDVHPDFARDLPLAEELMGVFGDEAKRRKIGRFHPDHPEQRGL